MNQVDLSRARWRKSTRRGAEGACVEVTVLGDVAWRKSSRSGGSGACVEVAALDGAVAVRDSKNPTGPALVGPPADWAAFVTAVAHDEFPTA